MYSGWLLIVACFVFFSTTASQQIWDIVSLVEHFIYAFLGTDRLSRPQWQTTWDRSKLFTSLKPSTPINFGTPSVISSADVVVDDTQTFQSIWGFGGSLSEL
jgi:hypothetical protein